MHSPEDLQKDRNKHTQTERCIVGNIIWTWHFTVKTWGRELKKVQIHIPTSRQQRVPLALLFHNFFASLLPAECLWPASELPHWSCWKQVSRQKGPFILLPRFFFLPFHTSAPVQLLSNQPAVTATKKIALTVFLLTYLFLTAKRVCNNSHPGKPLSSQRESNLSITCFKSLIQSLPEDNVQMQLSTRFANHRTSHSFMTGMTWEKNEEGRRRKHLISQ